MNYTSEDKDENGVLMPRGEVLYRGNNVFKGYFRQPDLTKETID
jgi:long-subunit acyl-CoA synthetase (AMP-forming)